MKEKLLEAGVNPVLVEKMSDEELKKVSDYNNLRDLENYLLALAIKYGI